MNKGEANDWNRVARLLLGLGDRSRKASEAALASALHLTGRARTALEGAGLTADQIRAAWPITPGPAVAGAGPRDAEAAARIKLLEDAVLTAWGLLSGHAREGLPEAQREALRDLADSIRARRDPDAPPACRVCGCTENTPCPGGCHRAADPDMGELCSRCAEAALIITVQDLTTYTRRTMPLAAGSYIVVAAGPVTVDDEKVGGDTHVLTLRGVTGD